MAPYKTVLFHAYGQVVLLFLAVLSLNLFGLALAIGRRFFLKNTGRKLSHIDRQFHTGGMDMPIPTSTEEGN